MRTVRSPALPRCSLKLYADTRHFSGPIDINPRAEEDPEKNYCHPSSRPIVFICDPGKLDFLKI
jgi:hypothetical protein